MMNSNMEKLNTRGGTKRTKITLKKITERFDETVLRNRLSGAVTGY